MEKTIIYARLASGTQEQLDSQIEMCKSFAKEKGFKVEGIRFDFGTSIGLRLLLNQAKQGEFRYLIVYGFDRLTRNRYDNILYRAEFKKYGVDVISATEQSSEMSSDFVDLFMKIYDDTIREKRLQRKLAKKKAVL